MNPNLGDLYSRSMLIASGEKREVAAAKRVARPFRVRSLDSWKIDSVIG